MDQIAIGIAVIVSAGVLFATVWLTGLLAWAIAFVQFAWVARGGGFRL